jgi:riboflavin biosynthesis pyrimidine reductase
MSPVLLEPLLPPGPALAPAELLATLRARERAHPDRPFTFLNVVASVDGRATLGGTSAGLGDEADLEMLLELRTLADAVLIGTGTLRAEGYDRLVRAPERRARRRASGAAEDPVAVLITASGDLPWDAGLFAAAGQPVLVYVAPGSVPAVPPGVAAAVEVEVLDPLTLAAAFADLRARGVRALLCEAGPTLNQSLLAAGLVDELFLTVAPLLVADDAAPPIVSGAPLQPPAGLALRSVARYGDELFLRYAVAGAR